MPTPVTPSTTTLVVEGCAVRHRTTGPEDAPTLLLVHGGAAHAGWWTAVEPDLARRYHLAIVELSGHGDSDHRPAYRYDLWVAELAAVVEHLDRGPVAVVGHSMGGALALRLAAARPDLVDRLVLLDARVTGTPTVRDPERPPRIYPTLTEGLANFRLRPRETTATAEVLDAVARAGITETDGGWRWKFDPRTAGTGVVSGLDDIVPDIRCPVGFLYGEHSPITDEAAGRHLEQVLGRPVPRIRLDGTFHNVTLDDPAGCVEGIERLLRA